MLPLVLPEIIIAVALLVMLNQLGMPLSLWTVVGGHVLICTPFAIAILSSAYRGLDRELEEASFDLGESRWGTFRRVTLPLVLPGVISSLLITFTISLDEFIIAFFLTGTDVTLPVYIWSQLRFPAKLPSVMALGTILLAVSVLLLIAAEVVAPPQRRAAGHRHDAGRCLRHGRRDEHGRKRAADDRDQRRGQEIRRLHGPARDHRRHPRRRILFAPRPLGLRQDDAVARASPGSSRQPAARWPSPARTWKAFPPTAAPPTWCSRATRSFRT